MNDIFCIITNMVFVQKHSKINAITVLTSDDINNLQNKNSVLGDFLDLSK